MQNTYCWNPLAHSNSNLTITSLIVKDFLLAFNNPLNFLRDFNNRYLSFSSSLCVPSVIISIHLNWIFYRKHNFASKEELTFLYCIKNFWKVHICLLDVWFYPYLRFQLVNLQILSSIWRNWRDWWGLWQCSRKSSQGASGEETYTLNKGISIFSP